MKLVIAIVNRDDAGAVTHNLSKNGFTSTKLASAGGFLLAGNSTLLIGVEEEQVQAVIDIIRQYSHSRRQMIPTATAAEGGVGYLPTPPIEVNVGGATVFVVDVERFERL
ncbi:MAG: cyclic-di-AMP receptor [Candidatus Enterenecus sp.]